QANINLPIDLLGSRRVVVKTDVGTSSTILSQIYEHNNEADNAAIDDDAINIQLPPLPDLIVENIQPPAAADSGTTIPITYTITNQGNAAATGTWRERVYISVDNAFQTFFDSEIGFFDFTGTLAAGQSVTHTVNVDIPISHSGPRWFVVTADMPIGSPDSIEEHPNDGNNFSIAGPTDVTLRYADLIVEAVSTSATAAQSGDPITVSWRVRNQGTSGTGSGGWFDRIVLSSDAILDINDTELKRTFHTGALGIDAAYTDQATVNLTEGISGTYYIFVETDPVPSNVFESTFENNNNGRALNPVDVTLRPSADLRIEAVTGPATAQPGQTVTVSWTGKNTGDGTAVSPWVDRLYISTSSTFSLVGATPLTEVLHAVPLPTQGIYTASAQVTIPSFIGDGTQYFHVVTDAGFQVFEGVGTGDSNNFGSSGPVDILHADLGVVITTAPATATSDTTIGIDWRVTNSGTGPASGPWVDRVYLSQNNVFDGEQTDIRLATVSQAGPLATSANYTAHADVTIPIDKFGDWFLLVVTDAGANIVELGLENNNTAASALAISLALHADLAVSNVTVANQVVGNPVQLTVGWTVSNAPTGTGPGKTGTWTDVIIASTDTVVGNSDDRLLGTFTHTGLLAVGDSYNQSQTFYLPVDFQGRYHIFVRTDNTGVVFEAGKEDNNKAEAANVVDIMPILYADLQVDSLTVPATGQSGVPLRVNWTVSNHGIGITNQGQWVDHVYLSGDPQGNSVIQSYGSFDHSGSLQPNGSYARTADLILPNTLSGPVYVVVETASGGSVFEFVFAGNNKRVSATSVNVSLSPTPDLAVTNIQTQTSAFEGSKIDITWTVTNQGNANAGGIWSDRVVLRKIGDTAGAITVGTFSYDRGLAAGLSYTRTEQFSLPAFIQGQYQVEVLTDVSNVVFERNVGAGTGEANNTVLDPDILTVQLRPRPDLQVSNVLSPASVPAGSGVSLEYTIINQGTAATPSIWKENV
ncbi:MAG: CARDB domain-containing protein, partial [Nitrospira sp.]